MLASLSLRIYAYLWARSDLLGCLHLKKVSSKLYVHLWTRPALQGHACAVNQNSNDASHNLDAYVHGPSLRQQVSVHLRRPSRLGRPSADHRSHRIVLPPFPRFLFEIEG